MIFRNSTKLISLILVPVSILIFPLHDNQSQNFVCFAKSAHVNIVGIVSVVNALCLFG